jgi:hypothetical protein
MKATTDEPLLIIARVAAPGAAKDEELNLVIRVTNGGVFQDTGMNLVVGVEMVLKCSRCTRFIR